MVAVDLDEVLGAFVPSLCEYHNEQYGTKLKLSDFFSYRFRDVSSIIKDVKYAIFFYMKSYSDTS